MKLEQGTGYWDTTGGKYNYGMSFHRATQDIEVELTGREHKGDAEFKSIDGSLQGWTRKGLLKNTAPEDRRAFEAHELAEQRPCPGCEKPIFVVDLTTGLCAACFAGEMRNTITDEAAQKQWDAMPNAEKERLMTDRGISKKDQRFNTWIDLPHELK